MEKIRDLLFSFWKGAGDECFEVRFGLFKVGFRGCHFQENIAGGVGDDGSEEHVVWGGDFVSLHHAADEVGAGHGDDGEFLITVGFFLGGDFDFGFILVVLELFFPTVEVGFDSAALVDAEVVELEEGAFFLAVVEGGLDHVRGGGGFDPGIGGGEGEVTDFECGVFGLEERERKDPENGDELHRSELRRGFQMCDEIFILHPV